MHTSDEVLQRLKAWQILTVLGDSGSQHKKSTRLKSASERTLGDGVPFFSNVPAVNHCSRLHGRWVGVLHR